MTGSSRPLQSRREPQGLTASETGDASLCPISCLATVRQTYAVPFARPLTSATGWPDAAGTSTIDGQVAPLSLEHSTWYSDTPGGSAGATSTERAAFSGWTPGRGGAAGSPIGVAVDAADVH